MELNCEIPRAPGRCGNSAENQTGENTKMCKPSLRPAGKEEESSVELGGCAAEAAKSTTPQELQLIWCQCGVEMRCEERNPQGREGIQRKEIAVSQTQVRSRAMFKD